MSIVQLLANLVSFRLECDNLCKVKSGSGQAADTAGGNSLFLKH